MPPRALVTLEELTFHTINTERGCTGAPGCASMADNEYRDTFYAHPNGPLSIVEFPDTGDEYATATCSRVARYNARRCERLGYRYERIDRADWEDDLYEIRSSSDFRQGRQMPAAYLERQAYGHDVPSGCFRHDATVHGIVGPDGHLAAYCQLVQCGDVVRVNTILGHWDRMMDGVVWMLCLESFRWHIDQCYARFGLYYTHHSGQGDGLRYFKERFGFRPTRVTWVL